jgi:hypothetical protein
MRAKDRPRFRTMVPRLPQGRDRIIYSYFYLMYRPNSIGARTWRSPRVQIDVATP